MSLKTFGGRSPISYLTVTTVIFASVRMKYSHKCNFLVPVSLIGIVTILSRCQCHKLCSWDLDSCGCDSSRWFTVRCQCRDYGGTRLTPHSAPACTGGSTITKHWACAVDTWCHIACDINPAIMMSVSMSSSQWWMSGAQAPGPTVTRSLDSQHSSVSALYFLVVWPQFSWELPTQGTARAGVNTR